jgi:hypothetical protein
LAASTNVQAGAGPSNAAPSRLAAGSGTNASPQPATAQGTNAAAQATNAIAQATNAMAQPANAMAQATNAAAQPTNVVARATNAMAQATNAAAHGTNLAALGPDTSHPPSAGKGRTHPPADRGAPPKGMKAGPFPGMPAQGPPLPPAVQARLDRIIESEILASIMRPQPAALLGIMGADALVRAPSGQSGLLKEGEELGGLKLLKLGINRALIEEAGEKKELILFSGLGSESLMSTRTNSPK